MDQLHAKRGNSTRNDTELCISKAGKNLVALSKSVFTLKRFFAIFVYAVSLPSHADDFSLDAAPLDPNQVDPNQVDPNQLNQTSCSKLPSPLKQLSNPDLDNGQSLGRAPRMNTALFKLHSGKRIENIEISVHDIFDLDNPDENKPLFRLANRLQINTQKKVIKSQLLFKTGERLNSQKVDESLRRLFSRNYLIQAQAVITRACDDQVSLRIIVKDGWGIRPAISFSNKGGESNSSFGISDANFLGSGYQLAFEYDKTPDGNALSYFLRTENFLRNNYRLDITHTELPEGQSGKFVLSQPFLGLKSDWAYGIESIHETQEQRIRWQDQTIDRYDTDLRFNEIFVGRRVAQTGLSAWRIRAGVADHQEQLGADQAFDYQYLWMSLEKTTSHYRQYHNLNFIQQVDDVPVESQFQMRFGWGQDANNNAVNLINTWWQKPLVTTQHHLWQMSLSSRWLDLASEDQWSVRLDSHYYKEIDDHQRWVLKAHWQKNHFPQPHQQLVIGEQSGLRGYPNNFKRGSERTVLSLERRYYSHWHPFNILRLGAVAFWDIGRVWGEQVDLIGQPDSINGLREFESENNSRILSSIGLGLRLHSSKSGTPAVVHFNIGFPLVRERGANIGRFGFSASAEKHF